MVNSFVPGKKGFLHKERERIEAGEKREREFHSKKETRIEIHNERN